MKKLILSLAMLLSVFYVNSQEAFEDLIEDDFVEEAPHVDEFVEETPHVNWQASFEEAVVKAKEEHKPILVYFTGSDWCGPCKKLDENLFHTEKFIEFSDKNLVLYTADYPRNTDLVTEENRIANRQLSQRYQQESFPTMIMINENGSILGRKNGAYLVEYYYPFFEDIVRVYYN